MFALFVFCSLCLFCSFRLGAERSRFTLCSSLNVGGAWFMNGDCQESESCVTIQKKSAPWILTRPPYSNPLYKNSQNGTFLHFCRRVAAIKFKSSIIKHCYRDKCEKIALFRMKNVQLIPQDRTEFKRIKANHCELTCIITQLFNWMNVLFNVLFRIKPHFFTILSLFRHSSRICFPRSDQARTPRPALS